MGDREPVVSSKRSREQVPSVFTEKLMELSRRYRFIPKDERIPFLETQFISRVNGKLPWTILKKYSVVIEDTNGSQFFGFMEVDVDAGRYLSQPNQESVLNPLLILLESFQLVLEKFTKLRDDLGEHLVEKKIKMDIRSKLPSVEI